MFKHGYLVLSLACALWALSCAHVQPGEEIALARTRLELTSTTGAAKEFPRDFEDGQKQVEQADNLLYHFDYDNAKCLADQAIATADLIMAKKTQVDGQRDLDRLQAELAMIHEMLGLKRAVPQAKR